MSQDNRPAARARLQPIPEQQWTQAQRTAAASLANTRRGALRGPFLPLVYSPELLDRAQRLGEYLRYQSALPESLRELAILITARHWNQAYEWHVHAPLAEKSGLRRRLIDELAAGQRPGLMDVRETAVYEFCTQLHQRHAVGDRVYADALAALDERGIVDLCGICGYYSMLAMVMNVAQTALPPGTSAPFAPPEPDQPLP